LKKNHSKTITKLQKITSYDLLIAISDQYFQYAIVDNDKIYEIHDKKLTSYNTIEEKINTLNCIKKKNNLLNNKIWKRVKISFINSKFTLIPKLYFDKKYCHLYLKDISSYNQKFDQINFYNHKNLGFFNVFALEKKIYNWLNKSFNKNNITHIGSSLIEGFYKNIINDNKTLFIYFDDIILHILIYEKKTLIFYNFFLINGEKYKKYIFLTFKEFKLSQENTRVVISGNNTKLYLNNLKSYIKNISILNYSDFKLKDNESNFISLLFNNNL